MTNKIAFPTRGQTYTLEEINKLPLRDSPCLRIFHNNRWEYVQNASTDLGALCEKNPIIRDSRWVFERETHEWIPVFNFARDNEWPVELVVTMEPTKWVDIYGQPEPQQYVRFIGDYEPELTEYEQGMVNKRLAKPLPLPVVEVEQPVVTSALNPTFSMKEVVESITKPVIPSYSTQELTSDHVKAMHYLEYRMKDAVKFPVVTPLQWQEAVAHDFVQLYQSGHVNRFKPNHELAQKHWGVFNYFRNRELPPVYFASYECFVAWVLAKFW